MKTNLLSLFLACSFAMAQTPPGLPKTTLEMGAPDSTGQKTLYLCFHAEPGLRYTQQMAPVENIMVYGMENSFNDMGASIYGLGTDVRLPVYVFAPPDPATQQPVDEQYPPPPSAVINLMLSSLPNGQGIAVSWSNAYGTFSARRVFSTANTLTGVPFAGTWRSAEVDVIWSKMGEVETNDPASLNTPLDSYQQTQWTQIQMALPEILTGTGGAIPLFYSNAPTTGPIAVNGRWFRLKVEYPDSDSDGIPDWLEFAGFNSGGTHYQSNPFTSDTDGDGITDAEEWAAGTNPNDASSHPYKVVAVTPALGDGGSPLNGAVLFYFNDTLPVGFTLPPTTNLLWHVATSTTVNGAVTTKTYSLDPVAGAYSILPGRKTVAFFPSQDLLTGPDSGDSEFPKFNYLYDVTTTSTGLSSLIPLTNLPATLPSPTYYYHGDLNGFSTTTLLDTVGPAVMKTSPSWNYVDVDPSSQPSVTWNQPLDPATVNSSNITLIEKDTGTPVACNVSFDYSTDSYFAANSFYGPPVQQWRPANKLKLMPAVPLKNDTSYTVTLGTGLKNLKGLPLLNEYSWSFRTRPAPAPIVAGAGPYIVSMTSVAYHKKVTSYGLPITFTFNQAMDASTLTTDTVHLTLHGSSQDEPVTLSYNAASKTLTLTTTGLQNAARYELKLDGENIKGASGSGSGPSLQGAEASIPFYTASYEDEDPNNPEGDPDPDGSGDPDQPANITLALRVGDDDAGSSGVLTATLPDGKTQVFPIPGATDSTKTTNSPEFPDGTSFVITPEFTIGSDDQVEHEKLEVGVTVSMANLLGAATSSTYLVFKESNGVTTFDGTLENYQTHIAHCAATVEGGNEESLGPPEKLKIKPLHIVPIDTDKGRLGDIVPSNNLGKEGAEEHFVTPKKSDQLNDPYVTFKVDLTDVEFTDFEWGTTGEAVDGQVEQRKVKRDATGKTTLTLKKKGNGNDVAKLNVWVVWATPAEGYPKKLRTISSISVGGYCRAEFSSVAFLFDIAPKELFEGFNAGRDVPKLDGRAQTIDDVNPETAISIDEDSAARRWDVSRHIRVKLKDKIATPSIVASDYSMDRGTGLAITASAGSFPTADLEVRSFPSDLWRGNDDGSGTDEDDLPYSDKESFPKGDGEPVIPKPAIGQIASYDRPGGPGIREASGTAGSGEEVEAWLQFEEFARLELGEGKDKAKWYVICEPKKWESIKRFKRKTWLIFGAEQMRENGSTTDFGHSSGY